MILDTNALIAILDDQDLWHRQVADLVVEAADRPLHVHELNLAEALVLPARLGRADDALGRLIDDLGIDLVDGEHRPGVLHLATIRAETGMKMPDCVALASAERCGVELVTFDTRLRSVARRRGVPLEPRTDPV